MTKQICILLTAAVFVFASGCSKRPVLYDNETYRANPAKADQAIEDCMAKAEQMGAQGSSKLGNAAYNAAAGGTASAAAGGAAAAAGNAFGGNYDVGGSMGMSAAAGTAGNFVLGMFDRDVDPIFSNYVQKCLHDKGYNMIGWK